MCYIILPRPELIYYVQHRLYTPIGAIANDWDCPVTLQKKMYREALFALIYLV